MSSLRIDDMPKFVETDPQVYHANDSTLAREDEGETILESYAHIGLSNRAKVNSGGSSAQTSPQTASNLRRPVLKA